MKTTLMTLAVAATCCSLSSDLSAQETETTAELAETEEKSWSVGVDVDFFSAYVWRNAVMNDQLVLQPCVWGEWTVCEPFSIGGFVWQSYDLTRQRSDTYRYALAETDYNVHVGATAWASEEEEFKLDLELGHDWYTYHGVHGEARNANPDTREIYAKATFENPFVTVYGQVSWLYEDFGDYTRGVHYELGFTREYEVDDALTVGADWNLGFADGNYQEFLYGTDSSGFTGTTLKLYANYALADWATIGAKIAYTGVLNGNARNEIGDWGDDWDFCGGDYPRDLLWGGISLNLEF